jgi:hypothetical protein
MSAQRSGVLVRLRPEDREVVRRLATYYDISEADVLKMALREFLQKRKNELPLSEVRT